MDSVSKNELKLKQEMMHQQGAPRWSSGLEYSAFIVIRTTEKMSIRMRLDGNPKPMLTSCWMATLGGCQQ